MRKYFISILVLAFAGIFIYSFTEINKKQAMVNPSISSFYQFNIKSLDGSKTISMKTFAGKKILCVNVASECGYTPQYADLQKLHEQFGSKLVVIGFPCNQFGGQEPGTANEIQAFCKKNYGVTFILTEKIEVKGSNQHPIYQWLTQKSLNGKEDHGVQWNFNKFLIDENGNWLAYFPSGTNPLSNDLIQLLK